MRERIHAWMSDEELMLCSHASDVLGDDHPRVGEYLDLYADVLLRIAAATAKPTPIETHLAMDVTIALWEFAIVMKMLPRFEELVELADDASAALRHTMADAEITTRLRELRAAQVRQALNLASMATEGLHGIQAAQEARARVIPLRGGR